MAEEWPHLNRRRLVLIRKQLVDGLTIAEAVELQELQRQAPSFLRKMRPNEFWIFVGSHEQPTLRCRVERVYYCRPCAENHARTSRMLMWFPLGNRKMFFVGHLEKEQERDLLRAGHVREAVISKKLGEGPHLPGGIFWVKKTRFSYNLKNESLFTEKE